MKKSLLFGLAIAVVGSTAAIGGAFATYVSSPNNVIINIGARTDTDYSYTITGVQWNSGSYNPLQPGVTDTLNFSIGASKGPQSTYLQNNVVGTLRIEVVSSNAAFLNYFSGNVEATIGGYTAGTHFTQENRNKVSLVKDNNENPTKLTGSTTVAFAMSGHAVTMPISIPSNIANATLMTLADAAYTVNIYLDKPAEFDYAYLSGSMSGSNWGEVDEWQMVPAIDTNVFTWEYVFTSAQKAKMKAGDAFKARKGNQWWNASGGNWDVTAQNAGKISKITWTGATDNTGLDVTIDA